MKKVFMFFMLLCLFVFSPGLYADSVSVDLYGHPTIILDPNGTITINCHAPLDRICCTVTYNDESTQIQIFSSTSDDSIFYTVEPNTDVGVDPVNNSVTFLPEN